MNANNHQAASDFLANIDADWARLISTVGACSFAAKPAREPYETLIRALAYQQLHAKAGDAIISRLLALHDARFPAPQQLLATEFDALRQCGFSARKIETLQAIAAGALSGLIPSWQAAQKMADEELIARLVIVKGIGRWTVEMLLMFSLQRMDVLPAADFAIAAGYQRLKQLPLPPKPKQMAEIAKLWSPHRSIASWYLWRVPKEIPGNRL